MIGLTVTHIQLIQMAMPSGPISTASCGMGGGGAVGVPLVIVRAAERTLRAAGRTGPVEIGRLVP